MAECWKSYTDTELNYKVHITGRHQILTTRAL